MTFENEDSQHQLVCCKCGAFGPSAPTREQARDLAADDGWDVDETGAPETEAEDVCPDCTVDGFESEDGGY